MEIRSYGVADFRRGLLESLNALSDTHFDPPSRAALFAEHRRRKGVNTFVAVEGDEVVGTYSVFVEPKFIHGGSWVGHIEDVAVRPDRQGRGVGRALVEHAVAFCKRAGCYKAVLHCSPELVPFYERAGFYHNGSGMRLDIDPNEEKD